MKWKITVCLAVLITVILLWSFYNPLKSIAENKDIHTTVESLAAGDPVLAKALSANENYQSITGTIIKNSTKGGSSADVVLQQEPAKYSIVYTPDTSNPGHTIIDKNRGDKVLLYDTKEQSRSITDAIPTMKPPRERDSNTIYPNWNGTHTLTDEVNVLLHPEMAIQGLFTRSKVTNEGTFEIAGRSATKYTVDPVSKKEQVEKGKYEYFFDNELGILLRIAKYDRNRVIEEVYFEVLFINSEFDQDIFEF